MAIIYGKVSFHNQDPTPKLLHQLIDVIHWESSTHFEIEEENFIGGIFISKSHPYDIKDFYYFDRKNEIIVLMSGVIYNGKNLCKHYNIKIEKITNPIIILELYLKFQESFVSLLNGDFAILIHDYKKQKTRIFRDHVGIHPIAYSLLESNLYFSSDFLGLSKALYQSERIDELYILQDLTINNLWDYTLTPNKQVVKILPAHFIEYSKNEIQQIKYWFPEKILVNKKLEFDTAISDLRNIVFDAVKIRSDKRFYGAAHLSGGIDSGIVAALAKKEFTTQKNFYGFSWSPNITPHETFKIDERSIAKEISDFAKINLKLSEVSSKDFIEYLSDWRCRFGYFDEHRIRKDAKELGVNLLFSGWGGDEFISIHDIGIDSDLLFNFNWISFLEKNPLTKPKALLATLFHKVILPFLGNAYFLNRFSPTKQYAKYLKLNECKKGKSRNQLLTWRSRKDIHVGYIYYYHLASRMEEWFISGSRIGIEYRYPLVDKRIIEYLIALPSKLLYKEKRILIKQLCKNILPQNAIKQNKLEDEAWGAIYDELIFNSFETLINEIDLFKENPYLSFIDFDALTKDIIDYKNKPRPIEFPNSFRLVFFIKSIHTFTTNFSI